ncbi:MAG: AbrB/MazE/SpoVT family DNA-binding domain-containing protein [Verrucomicrobia bacterium]|nr:AbrB/MazE/SpoVT family DNA-binding domain-containing protein [Verrucomicrobiota bacterium]
MALIEESSPATRRAALFRSGRDQVLRIPQGFELPGNEVILHREGTRIVIEPIPGKPSLLAVVASMQPWTESFPEVNSGVLPLDDIAL